MTIKLITAGVILVAAIIFGFIFWNQFNSNQQELAGNNHSAVVTPTPTPTPKEDSISAIEIELNQIDVNSLDSDSAAINSEFSGF